jgi:PAS domain S-box-containing protein
VRTARSCARRRPNLRAQLTQAAAQIEELQTTLQAIRSGEVDGIVVEGPRGSSIFTLQSPEEPYRILAERMNEGAATLDAQGTVLFCNHQLSAMLQLPAERIVGAPLAAVVPPEERSRLTEWIAAARVKSIRTEGKLRRGDGTLLFVQLSLSQIPLEDLESGICLVATDLTEQKRAQEQIRRFSEEMERKVAERTEQLHAANADLEAFNYGVAHDLRAPLRHIQGFSDILLNEPDSVLGAEGERHLRLIIAETLRMGKLIEALLSISRVGRQALQPCDLDLNSVVEEVIENLELDLKNRQIDWRVGHLPTIRCDPTLTRIAFFNLLANAVKFTSRRERASIEIAAERQNREYVFCVRDNGVGFSMKYADKLFGVFQRLHRAEDFEGTGVGLATVQRIIQKHGGRIWAEAELDKGASFYFTLGSSQGTEKNSKAMIAGVKS